MCLARALEERARPLGCAIAFPEGEDPRVVEAAHTLARRGVARPVLIRRDSDGTGAGIDGDGLYTEVVPSGVDPLERAAGMLRRGEVDGVVAGAVHTSAQVIRTGLKYIGLRDDVGMLSSCFFMEVGPFRSSRPEVLVFADAGVVPQPDADVMAETARECARIRGVVVQDEPVIAFLSYSTLGSADGDAVERVRAARARLCQMAPDIRADGELQADAALIPGVASIKAPDSSVAGRANILVFPNLDAANIAYKLVQRLAGARALGPILLGLRSPLNDLSRGATPRDISQVAAITALMAGQAKPGGA